MGVDVADDVARSAWAFLCDDVRAAAATFTRRAYAWNGLDAGAIHVIPPCIDPQSLKNVELEEAQVGAILRTAGSWTDGRPKGPRSRGATDPRRRSCTGPR